MKKLLVSLLLVLTSSAFASKARIASLQEANHLVDTQTVFVNPAHINLLNPYITYEMGTPGGTTTSAEGGFSRKLADGTLGIYVGHDNTGTLRDGTTLIKQRNPVEVIFGTGNMAFSGSVSTTDDKKNGKKETTLVGKFGMLIENKSFWGSLALISKAEDKTSNRKVTESPRLRAGGDITIDQNRFFGSLEYGQYKSETANVETTIKDLGVELGWLNHGLKNKDADIYYGAKLTYAQRDNDGPKITTTALPIFLGLEYNVTSWATFRGSIKQNFILGETKDETATNQDAQSTPADTTFSGGLGFKYNQITLDGSLAASTNGAINGNAFLTQASVTYNF